MKRRKHRLVLEVTFTHPVTKRMAAKGTQLVMDNNLELGCRPIWCSQPPNYLQKVRVKEPR